jgi:ABC-type sugar transport system ATPase subunit
MALGDRIVVMRQGVIAQIGTPREIYFEPASRFVAEFVGAANIVEGVASEGAIVLPGGRIRLADGMSGKITLMLRPETITIVSPDAAELHGRIESVTFIGDRQRIVIADAAARPLLVDAPNTVAAAPGERVGLHMDPARIRVLSEERAGSEGATPSPRRGRVGVRGIGSEKLFAEFVTPSPGSLREPTSPGGERWSLQLAPVSNRRVP